MVYHQPAPRALPLSSRLSISEFMLPGTTFEHDLDTCVRAGAAGMGIWEDKLGLGRDRELQHAFAQSGLAATVCVASAPSVLPLTFIEGPSDPDERIDQFVASITRLGRFRPAAFIAITGVDASLAPSTQRRIVVDGFRRVGEAAAEVGAVVAIEPMRNRPSDSLVASVAEAADLVDEIAVPSVGILFDMWHHWDSPSVFEDIARYASLFTAVQVGDWPDRANPGYDRAIPGTGVIPIDRIFSALESAGYRGWYDLELVADPDAEDSLHKMDRDLMLQMTTDALEAAWTRAVDGDAERSP